MTMTSQPTWMQEKHLSPPYKAPAPSAKPPPSGGKRFSYKKKEVRMRTEMKWKDRYQVVVGS